MPESPAPLDALRSDDRGTRDDEDDVDDGEEAVLFMDPQPTIALEEVGGGDGARAQLGLQVSGLQDSMTPFPRDGESPSAGGSAGSEGNTGESSQLVVCAGGTSAPAVITAGMNADTDDTRGGQRSSPELKVSQQDTSSNVVGASAGVRCTGDVRGNIGTVVPKVPPLTDARSASPGRETAHGHASDVILAPAVKDPYPDYIPSPRPFASSSSSSSSPKRKPKSSPSRLGLAPL